MIPVQIPPFPPAFWNSTNFVENLATYWPKYADDFFVRYSWFTLRQLFYLVTPDETTFARIEDVPNWFNEVGIKYVCSCGRNVSKYTNGVQYSRSKRRF